MLFPLGSPDDRTNEALARSESVGPIVPRGVIGATASGFMDWEERLRTTAEMLQRLSGGYPPAWDGGVRPTPPSSPSGADPAEGPDGAAVRE
jgi:hypothetical protein